MVSPLEFSQGESAIYLHGVDFELPNRKEDGIPRVFLVL